MPRVTRASVRKSRRPNYGSGGRLVRLFLLLMRTPRGRDLPGLARELSISERTVRRYADTLLNEVPGQDGLPLFEMVRDSGAPRLRLRTESQELSSSEFQAAAMFLASSALRSLRGTVVGDGADEAWDKFKETLPKKTRDALQSIERKFFYVPFAAKNYTRLDDRLGLLMRAVLRQERLRLRYRRADGQVNAHVFEPWTFVLYRDGLYLLGPSSRHKNPVYLAVDRIDSIEHTGETFACPSDFDPAKYTSGVFGIWRGPETKVALRLTGRAAEQVPERVVHPSQTFTELRGGAILMRLELRGWQELAWWILSFGGDIEVLEPKDLRDYVKREVREAAALYER